ncbi:MAG: DUF6884 domain-containing protein [Solirubrobacteraceae bacterium]
MTADDVREALVGHRPGAIHRYWVDVDGRRWPVKQVVSLATGLERADFQSQSSRRLLTRLGFEVGPPQTSLVEAAARPRAAGGRDSADDGPSRLPDVVLISCVRSKGSEAALARDLYVSDYFAKMRVYAERSGAPWFILSAEHGLVSPDTRLEPYDRYLADLSVSARREWGGRVATQLAQAVGPLEGLSVEVHAGATYVDAVAEPLRSAGARVVDRLQGLPIGRRLSWYRGQNDVIGRLRDGTRAQAPGDVLAAGGADARVPGLYSWWVDDVGAAALSRGTGHDVAPGLIYVGQAGATRRGGTRSSNTLWSRIAKMHLGDRRGFSTLRLSIGSILANTVEFAAIDEASLTRWMHEHLRVVLVPVPAADTLGELEREILVALDPPLNLAKVPATSLRRRLTELRKAASG